MIKEEYLQQLLKDLYEKDQLDVYDHSATLFCTQSEEFSNTKSWADQLVREKLAKYTEDNRAALYITNFGKYWMLKGGYEMFLKEGQSTRDRNKEKEMNGEKEKLLEARLRLTQYRLAGFWLALVISCIGFALSLFNLYLLLKGKK